jgi:predicted dienelactone hydrolase
LLGDGVSDGRPVLHCIVAWWPNKSASPVVRPKGMDLRDINGKRVVQGATVTLADAVAFSDAGFEVMTDPFDLEDLTRFEQIERSKL